MKTNMFATKERRKKVVIALSMVAVLLITGIMALFTDHEEATNVFTVGSIDIELTEPNWVEANATEIAPNQVIAKDPMITNVGKNDAYTFIKVDIPKQDGNPLFELLDKNGNPGVNDGWVLVETGETADTITYVYGYAADDAMTRVTPDAPTNVTENLFSSVKVSDVEEFKTDSCDIIVTGYGIQADDIPTAPADVWPLIKDTYFPKYEMITSPASIGCGRDALFASDAPADIFKEVRVDGTAIASANYTKSGTTTTEITLKGSYTGTLSKEMHTIEIVSNDGFAKSEFEVEEPINIVAWADGTDEEIVAMVAAADAGKINLADYWSVGDERQVTLSAMSATGVGESHAEQTVTLVLMHQGGYELADGSTCNFVVGQKNGLAEKGYMNSTNTNSGSWDGSARRAWCNSTYYNAYPAALKPIFKQFKTITAETYDGTTLKTSVDYFALPAEKEITGSKSYSNSTEAACTDVFQFDYYKTSANIIKKQGDSGSAYTWWERSPGSGNSGLFCRVYPDGRKGDGSASGSYLLAPFGCI